MQYYLGKNGYIYKSSDLTKAAYIMTGSPVIDLDKMKGIVDKINPTIEDFINAGQKQDAVRMHYNSMRNKYERGEISERKTLQQCGSYIDAVARHIKKRQIVNE